MNLRSWSCVGRSLTIWKRRKGGQQSQVAGRDYELLGDGRWSSLIFQKIGRHTGNETMR